MSLRDFHCLSCGCVAIDSDIISEFRDSGYMNYKNSTSLNSIDLTY